MNKKPTIIGILLALILVALIFIATLLSLNLVRSIDKDTKSESQNISGKSDTEETPVPDIKLTGGTVITLEVDESSLPEGKKYITEKDINEAIGILSARLDRSGYPNKRIKHNDSGQITVEIPEETDTEKAAELLGSVGLLEFKNDTGEVVLTGNDIKDATYQYGPLSETSDAEAYVELTLKSEAVDKFADATENAIGSYISICVDGSEISRPSVAHRIVSDKCIITGGFTIDSAKTLANQIKSGALPFALKVTYINQISPNQ